MPHTSFTPNEDEMPLVDPELERFLPVRSAKDSEELELALIREKCRDPIVVWTERNVIVDGHRRFKICRKHGIKFDVVYMDFADLAAVKSWMAKSQLAKRNLTDAERSYLIGSEYLAEKKNPGNQANGKSASPAHLAGSTAEKMAKRNKISERKVHDDAKFAAAVDAHEQVEPGSKAKNLSGEVPKSKVIATAPKKCPTCTRKKLNRPDCLDCAELRKAGKKTRPRPNGKPKLDWKRLKDCHGKTTRAFDDLFIRGLGMGRTNKVYAEANGYLNRFITLVEQIEKDQK